MKVSIVIPNFNGQKLLAQNLPFVLKAAPKAEIIIVDDASTDESVDFIKSKFPKIKLIQNNINLRYAKSCNKDAKAATGDIIIMLNSDVKPEKDFIKPLIKHFDNSQVFSVGCREVAEVNGKKVFSGRTQGKWNKGIFIHTKPEDQQSQDTVWNFGGSMAVDRKKFLELGGFDPIYSPAYWEDIDLSYRAKKKGWKILFEKNSVVYHQHESTNKDVFGKDKINKIALRNQIIFSMKYKPFIFMSCFGINSIYLNIKTKGQFYPAFYQALYRIIFYHEPR